MFCILTPCSDPPGQQECRPGQGGSRHEWWNANVSSHSETDSMDQIDRSLKGIIGESCYLFMDTLCRHYTDSGDYSEIWGVLTQVKGLESRVRTLKYQLGHWDDSNDPTKKTFDRICLTSCILEDLLMNAMEGADVAEMYARGVLLFQNYPLNTMY